MHPYLLQLTMQAHIDDLKRSADARRIADDVSPARTTMFGRVMLGRSRVTHRSVRATVVGRGCA